MVMSARPPSKFAPLTLVSDHYATFRNYNSKKFQPSDFVIYLGLPAAGLVASIAFGLGASDVTDVLTATAILTGLIFNAVLLISDLSVRARETAGEPRRTQVMQLAEQLRANISYAVLLGLLLSAFLGSIAMFTHSDKPLNSWLTGIVLFLGIQLLLTVLMVLKRVRALFQGFAAETEERVP